MSKVRILRVLVLDTSGDSREVDETELVALMRQRPTAPVLAEIECAREEWQRSTRSRLGSQVESSPGRRSPRRPERAA